MSRFLKVLIALLVIAGFVAPVAMAEDRLSLSGYYTLRAFSTDNVADLDDDADDSNQYFYQRLRMQSDIAVAEGVKVTMRADIAEDTAPDVSNDGANDFDVDKAFVTIDQEQYTLTLGQNAFGDTNVILVDSGFGVQATVALKQIPLTLIYHKDTEGTRVESNDDVDFYAADYAFGNYNLFVGMKDGVKDDDRMAVGLAGSHDLEAVKLAFEFDYIDGENAAGADEKGFQFFIDASTSLSEMTSVGAKLHYAQGQDGGDVQVVDLNGNDYSPENDGFMATTYGVFLGDTFDPSGMGAGVISLQPYVDVKINDKLAVHGHLNYAMAEDDDIMDFEATTVAASARYMFAANTNVDVAASYTDADTDGAYEDDAATTLGARLTVSF